MHPGAGDGNPELHHGDIRSVLHYKLRLPWIGFDREPGQKTLKCFYLYNTKYVYSCSAKGTVRTAQGDNTILEIDFASIG